MWAKLSARIGARAKDELYKLYGVNGFKDLIIDREIDPELFEFVEETKTVGPHFSNYSRDRLEHFARRIYELRKDNSSNTPG